MSSFKDKVQGWIDSGILDTEFCTKNLRITEATGSVVAADDGEHYVVIDDGLSSNEALGRITVMLPHRDCIWIAVGFSQTHCDAIEWLEDNGRVWITTGRYDVLFNEGPWRDEHD